MLELKHQLTLFDDRQFDSVLIWINDLFIERLLLKVNSNLCAIYVIHLCDRLMQTQESVSVSRNLPINIQQPPSDHYNQSATTIICVICKFALMNISSTRNYRIL